MTAVFFDAGTKQATAEGVIYFRAARLSWLYAHSQIYTLLPDGVVRSVGRLNLLRQPTFLFHPARCSGCIFAMQPGCIFRVLFVMNINNATLPPAV